MTAANVQIPQQPLNTPSKGDTSGESTGRNQRDRRYTVTFWDQHRFNSPKNVRQFPRGRPWWGEVEFAANNDTKLRGRRIPDAFVGPVCPGEHVVNDAGVVDRGESFASVWEAPWYPYQKYFKYNYQQSTISFDYPRMLLDERIGRRLYWEAASKIGVQLNLVVDPNRPPHPQIILALGEPSRMYKIAEAAQSGDPWLLGFIDEPNADLAAILKVHPLAGFSFDSYDPAVAEAAQEAQKERVSAVVAAGPSADLLEMVAAMEAKTAALEAKIAALETKAVDEPEKKARAKV